MTKSLGIGRGGKRAGAGRPRKPRPPAFEFLAETAENVPSQPLQTVAVNSESPRTLSLWEELTQPKRQPPDGEFNPPPEYYTPTRAPGGGIRWLVNGKPLRQPYGEPVDRIVDLHPVRVGGFVRWTAR